MQVRKSLGNGKKASACLKKFLRNYALRSNLPFRKTKDFEIQFQWRNKWPQDYITLQMKVGCESSKFFWYREMGNFENYQACFIFTLEKFSHVSI